MARDLDAIRDSNGDLPAYAWPGGYPVTYIIADGGEGYPVTYITADGGDLCAACANGGNGSRADDDLDADCPDDDQWRVVGYDILEGPEAEVRCDHCNTIIAFGPDYPGREDDR